MAPCVWTAIGQWSKEITGGLTFGCVMLTPSRETACQEHIAAPHGPPVMGLFYDILLNTVVCIYVHLYQLYTLINGIMMSSITSYLVK